MNETLDSQLSAMFDNELSAAECELLARRLSRDESLQARWRHYAVIGAAMRGEHGLALHINLAAKIRHVVAAEPALSGAHVAGKAGRSPVARRLWQGTAAVALAASVAAVSVFWLRAQSPLGAETLVAQTPAAAGPAAADTGAPDTYVVPVTTESRPMVPTAELANYVVAHSEYSAPLSRRNLLSSLVASETGTAPASQGSEEAPQSIEAARTNVQDAQ
jgi:sigma-E factor negative regulatory protein RseA